MSGQCHQHRTSTVQCQSQLKLFLTTQNHTECIQVIVRSVCFSDYKIRLYIKSVQMDLGGNIHLLRFVL